MPWMERRPALGAARPAPPPDDEDELDEPEDDVIGPVPTRRQAREWGLVLQSMKIGFELRYRGDGWVLWVPPAHRVRALEALEAYEQENANWPPPRVEDRPRHAPSAIVPAAFAALAAFFALTTGPAKSGSIWFRIGTADAQQLLTEPWRMVTALTLHADAKHILGNLIAGSIFGAALSRRLGPGAALFAMVIAGFAGNAANAVYHYAEGHYSIGASTAVFAAVGVLATVQFVMDRDRPKHRKRRVVEILGPIIGGLALLGALGSGGGVHGGKTDLWAHLFGFLAGAAVGLGAGWLERRRKGRPTSLRRQLGLGVTALAIVLGSWQLAFLR
jgi:membrane associated rhomboid family serine protease